MIGEVVAELNDSCDVITIDQDMACFLDVKSLAGKWRDGSGLWRPAEFYLTPGIIIGAFRRSRKYTSEWKRLSRDRTFIDSVGVSDREFADCYRPILRRVFYYGSFTSVLFIELVKRAINIERPDALLITCAYCELGRAAVVAGKLAAVPTLEIQHGLIHRNHQGYIHTGNRAALAAAQKEYPCPYPDMTAVFGTHYRELLVSGGLYPDDAVIVTGQPRYDFFGHMDEIYSRKSFGERHGIERSDRIVLFALAFRAYGPDRIEKYLRTLFNAARDIGGITVIIKPHPWDGAGCRKVIKNVIGEYGARIILMPDDCDTYELMYVCDLMITQNSTTGTEAVALGKPLIIISLYDETDHTGCIENGIAVAVSREEDLKPAMGRLLENGSDRAENRQKFIESYFHSIDGKAAERVVSVIIKMIK
jgi:hypothetical protein